MKKLEELTTDQEAQMKTYVIKTLDKVFKYELFNSASIAKTVEVTQRLYALCNLKSPLVLLMDSPMGCQIAANLFKNPANVGANVGANFEYHAFSSYGNCTDMGWVAFYRFFEQYCNIKINKSAELRLIEEVGEQSFLSIQMDGLCIVSKYPNKICRDDENRLHNTNGFAVEFADGYGQYYIHGRAMPAKLFEQEITKEMFLQEENEDIKAGMYEIIESRGEGTMLTFLGAKVVHEQSFVHANGDIEKMALYKTTETFEMEEDLNGKTGVPLCWLKITCPSTDTVYLIPSDSSFNTCEEAAKYARPEFVAKEVPYEWFSRS